MNQSTGGPIFPAWLTKRFPFRERFSIKVGEFAIVEANVIGWFQQEDGVEGVLFQDPISRMVHIKRASDFQKADKVFLFSEPEGSRMKRGDDAM